MSAITINRSHQFSIDDLKIKIDELKKDIENRFEVQSEWESDQILLFRRKGLNGSIEIDDSNFQLKVNLSMMLRMLSAQIENEIVSVVDGHLGV
jgi:putative polyhydroxyalkanoate system protein